MHSIITQLSLILISSFISIYILFDFFNKIFFRIYRSKIVYVISFLGIWSIFSFINIYSIGILNLLFSLIAPLLTAKFLYKFSTKKEYGMILLFILSLNIAEIVSEVVFSLLFSKHFNILPGNILVDLIIFSLYQFAMYFLLKKNSKINIQASSLALLIVPIISIIIILIITYTMAETNNEALLISLLWVCISIFLADIYIYYLFNKLASLYNQKSQWQIQIAFIMSALFSTAIVTVSAVILRIDNQHILPFCYQLRDIHAKRTVATLMNPCFFLIDPHPAQMIYCSKMQQYSSPDFFFRYLKSSSVPDSRYKICKSDS